MATKKHTTDNGSRCSGYGVYPNGRKCKGCSDCEGKKVSTKLAVKRFNDNHSVVIVGKNFDLKKHLKTKPKTKKRK